MIITTIKLIYDKNIEFIVPCKSAVRKVIYKFSFAFGNDI